VTPTIRVPLLAAVVVIGLSLTAPAEAQQDTMSFFVTSVGKDNGADLGGLSRCTLSGARPSCRFDQKKLACLSKYDGARRCCWSQRP
jgi:hypothetical protein